ncbi:MAG: TetR/AcrR family transcriptional regulator [Actinomycetota bacterium]
MATPSTRERLMAAAIETLREEGITGTTARSIAQRAGVNQALIFYHFHSVTNLLLEAFLRTSEEQVARYRAAAEGVSSLHDLVAIARRLHDDDLESGAVTAVTQLMAATKEPELNRQILERFDDWIAIVEEALRRATASGPLASAVPVREAAYAISAMFLGIEILTRLDPSRSEAPALFDMMANAASMIEAFAPLLPPPAATEPGARG